jgi:ribosomal protein S18 acetylase RimI-like enzyme
MSNIILRPFTQTDITQVTHLQQAYASMYPGAPVFPGEMYLSPAFHEGQDVTCAFASDANEEERLVAYAPVYAQIVEDGPAELPHRLWMEIKAHPGLADPEQVKDLLLERVARRALELVQPFPGRAAHLIFEYRTNETPAVQYVLARGFRYTESVFTMRRDLNAPFPPSQAPEGIAIRRWKMESEPEQQAYVAARNECFPEAPVSLGEWQYYLQSPQWAVGTMIAAISGAELVGAVHVYWNAEENQKTGRKMGSTEDIFVRQPWRKRGIARAAIIEGMRYLKEHGLEEASLGVRALNENALGLYKALGYQVVQEYRFYAREL